MKRTMCALLYVLLTGYVFAAPPIIDVETNLDVIHPGETLRILLSTTQGDIDNTVDRYIAIALPDGSLWFYTPTGAWSALPAAFVQNASVSSADFSTLFSLTIGSGLPVGTYTVYGALIKPGKPVDISNLVSLDQRTFTYDPTPVPQGEPSNPSCDLAPSQEGAAQGNYRHWSFLAGTSIGDLAIAQDGRRLVVGDQSGKLILFKRDSSTPLWTYTSSLEQFNDVAMSQDGAVVGASDGTKIYLFECDQSTPSWTFDPGEGRWAVQDVAISHDGRYFAALTYKKIYLFRRDMGTPLRTFPVPVRGNNWLTTLKVSGDGSHLVAGPWISDSSGSDLYYFDQQGLLWAHRMSYQYQNENAVEMPLAISKDGTRIACGGSDWNLHFFHGNSSTPVWSYKVAQQDDDQVSSLAISDDGSRLVAAGSDLIFFFDDTTQGSPSWTFNGNYVTTSYFGTPVVYENSNTEQPLNYGIGHYEGTVSISGDGKYMVVGPWNSGHLFSLYKGLNRPFRMYVMSDVNDPVTRVTISRDGAWVVAGNVFAGEVHLWEVAPAEMVEIDVPVTVTIPENPLPEDFLDLDDLRFTRYLVKPGRAAKLKETWSIWALIQGIPTPPEILTGNTKKEKTLDLPNGNYDSITQESMEVPQIYKSFLSTVTAMLFRAQLMDEPSSKDLSDEQHLFVQVQIGTGSSQHAISR